MKIKIYKPNDLLKHYIQYYWVLENDKDSHTEFVYPTGEIQILFHYKKPFIEKKPDGSIIRQPQFALFGQRTDYSNIESSNDSGTIGIVFYPHSPSIFFSFPMNEINGYSINLSDVCTEWKILEERIAELNDNFLRIKNIEEYFIKKINLSNQHHYLQTQSVVKTINQSFGFDSIRSICNNYKMTEKSLQRLFHHYVGISPKKYSDIVRINHAIKLLKTDKSFFDVTFESGFYDQAHFIRALKKYTGYTPAELKNLLIQCKMSDLYNED